MSKRLLSKCEPQEYRERRHAHLRQPRDPSKSWVLKMVTSPDLVGLPNPWDGKAFLKTIARGPGTRHFLSARKLRDILLGDIRRLQDGEAFSLAPVVEWREAILAARKKAQEEGDPFNVGVEFVLSDQLEQPEARGVPSDQLKRFAHVATGSGFPLDLAHTQYVEARRVGNPYGYAPLKRTTVMNLDRRGSPLPRRLPPIRPKSPSPEGLSAQTAAKNATLIQHLWVWAIENGHLGRKAQNPWEFRRGVPQKDTTLNVKGCLLVSSCVGGVGVRAGQSMPNRNEIKFLRRFKRRRTLICAEPYPYQPPALRSHLPALDRITIPPVPAEQLTLPCGKELLLCLGSLRP
ncbi:hypothetical protein [Rhodovulum adriaticum]|nr:hypothetical protein [Rhodovulum adriaticum]